MIFVTKTSSWHVQWEKFLSLVGCDFQPDSSTPGDECQTCAGQAVLLLLLSWVAVDFVDFAVDFAWTGFLLEMETTQVLMIQFLFPGTSLLVLKYIPRFREFKPSIFWQTQDRRLRVFERRGVKAGTSQLRSCWWWDLRVGVFPQNSFSHDMFGGAYWVIGFLFSTKWLEWFFRWFCEGSWWLSLGHILVVSSWNSLGFRIGIVDQEGSSLQPSVDWILPGRTHWSGHYLPQDDPDKSSWSLWSSWVSFCTIVTSQHRSYHSRSNLQNISKIMFFFLDKYIGL